MYRSWLREGTDNTECSVAEWSRMCRSWCGTGEFESANSFDSRLTAGKSTESRASEELVSQEGLQRLKRSTLETCLPSSEQWYHLEVQWPVLAAEYRSTLLYHRWGVCDATSGVFSLAG